LTGRKPTTVILSHYHPDHWGGMQVFADCPILATPDTRKATLPIAKEMQQDQLDPSRMEQELKQTEARLAAETDPTKHHTLQVSVTRQHYDLQTLPTLRPTLPTQTFNGKIIFHGTQRSAELIATGKGHTQSDCILQLPKESIAFIGDIGFFQSQPFMPYGFPNEWVALLHQLADSKMKIFIPGHGPVGKKSDLRLEAKYICALEEMVRQVIQQGGTMEDALHQTLPPPFDAWQVIGHRFEANVRASFKRQSLSRKEA
jgi:glyoxylase-like metal-dependent hydrolase (beta-lactamase superfamily II)